MKVLCPNCKGKVKVTCNYPGEEGVEFRTRKCPKCGLIFTTAEVQIPEELESFKRAAFQRRSKHYDYKKQRGTDKKTESKEDIIKRYFPDLK